jgi:hypothetical protein
MPQFFVRDIAADYTLRSQIKARSSPNHRSLRSATLLCLIFSYFHSHANWTFRCRDIAGVPPPVTLNPFVRKYVASEGYVAYSSFGIFGLTFLVVRLPFAVCHLPTPAFTISPS